MQRFITHVIWTCPNCHFENSQDVDAPPLNLMAEKSRDHGGEGMAELSCGNCDVHYTGTAYSNPHEVQFEMDEPQAFEARGDGPMYEPEPDDYFPPPPPDDPFGIALEALDQLEVLVDDGDSQELGDPQFRNRLVFSGSVAALEAYLGDTIRKVVETDHAAFIQFATTNDVMKQEVLRLTMPDILNDPGLLTQTFENQLRSAVDKNLSKVLYHNLPKVMAIYHSVGGYNLFTNQSDKAELIRYMMLRHDCVHRNGFDVSKTKHTIFDRIFVIDALERIKRTILHIDNQVSPF